MSDSLYSFLSFSVPFFLLSSFFSFILRSLHPFFATLFPSLFLRLTLREVDTYALYARGGGTQNLLRCGGRSYFKTSDQQHAYSVCDACARTHGCMRVTRASSWRLCASVCVHGVLTYGDESMDIIVDRCTYYGCLNLTPSRLRFEKFFFSFVILNRSIWILLHLLINNILLIC